MEDLAGVEVEEAIPEQLQLQVLEFLVAMYKLSWPPPAKPLYDFFQVDEVELEIEQLKWRIPAAAPKAPGYPLPVHCDGD